ncbi:hypothetical protein MMC07_000106 [Pseudocyphellaria aurata]|nr:hypothetical protein [Pseudocyphellaria aurata]
MASAAVHADELYKIIYPDDEALEQIKENAEKVAKAGGETPQIMEKLLDERALLLRLIAEKKPALVAAETTRREADDNDKKTAARHNDWLRKVAAQFNDVELHKAYVARLSGQVFELKDEARQFEQTGDIRYAPSLIIGEITLHRLKQATSQLRSMNSAYSAALVKLDKLRRRAERTDDALRKAVEDRDNLTRAIKGLVLQAVQDEAWLLGLGWKKPEKEEEKPKDGGIKEVEREAGALEELDELEEGAIVEVAEAVPKDQDKSEQNAVPEAGFRALTVAEARRPEGK